MNKCVDDLPQPIETPADPIDLPPHQLLATGSGYALGSLIREPRGDEVAPRAWASPTPAITHLLERHRAPTNTQLQVAAVASNSHLPTGETRLRTCAQAPRRSRSVSTSLSRKLVLGTQLRSRIKVAQRHTGSQPKGTQSTGVYRLQTDSQRGTVRRLGAGRRIGSMEPFAVASATQNARN